LSSENVSQVSRSSAVSELFGTRLRELRQAAGLTQQALAERAGLPHTHISAMERGIKLPNLLTLLRLAVALDCKAAQLVGVFDETQLAVILAK
jgi:transcriptional regulator with XRE-family HTH domain